MARTGRQDPRRPARAPRRRSRLRRPGRELPRRARRARRRPVRFVTCRHEGGAANMADAYGKLTGRPGICMVTRGPGATQASVGVHTAFQDSTPLILLIGQVAREHARARGVPGDRLPPDVRADGEVGRPDRPRRADPRAASRAPSGRRRPGGRGPSCSRCRRTCSSRRSTSPDARPYVPGPGRPRPRRRSRRLRELLDARGAAARGRRRGAVERRRRTTRSAPGARRARVPVAAAWRCQDYVDNDSPCLRRAPRRSAPTRRSSQRVRDADVLLVIGARLGEIDDAAATRSIEPPGVGRRRSSTSTPTPTSSGASTSRRSGSSPLGRRFAVALAATPPLDPEPRVARSSRSARARLPREPRRPAAAGRASTRPRR